MITTAYLKSGAVWYYEGLPYRIKTHVGIEGITGGYDGGLYATVEWWGDTMIQVKITTLGLDVTKYLLFEDMEPSKLK